MKAAPAAWKALLEGELVAAEAGFAAASGPVADVGRARVLLERAELFEALGGLVAESQLRYLEARRALLESEPKPAAEARARTTDLLRHPEALEGLDRWLAERAGGAASAPPCAEAAGPLAETACRAASSSVAAAFVAKSERLRVGDATLELFDPARWWAAAEGLRRAAAPLAPAGALRALACGARADGACAETGTEAPEPPAPEAAPARVAADFGRLTEELARLPAQEGQGSASPCGAEEGSVEAITRAAEAGRRALESGLEGPGARALRAAGLPDLGPDECLRRAALARLERGEGEACPEALDLLQRSRDHRRPDALGRRNRPRLFVALARAASCAGRHAEALGAIRTLAAVFPEAEPAAGLVQRVATAAIVGRGATGEQKTNR